VVLVPALEVFSIDEAAAPYANPLVFLFMGGFMLALAMQRWNLHRRVALRIVSAMGTRPTRLVGGFMLATAFLSMWMSNTATAVMMLPIGISVLGLADGARGMNARAKAHFASAMVLGIAYAASIGGLGTLIGTPPNALLAAYMRSSHGMEITFAQWMMVGVPLVLILLPLTWLMLTRVIYRLPGEDIPGGAGWLHEARVRLGPISRPEGTVALVFGMAGVLWIAGPFLAPGLTKGIFSDAGIAMSAALLLFLVPTGKVEQRFVLDWETAGKLPWGVLLLFGGGLSLADALTKTGVAKWMGSHMQTLGMLPFPVIVLIVACVVVALSEVASNTATAAAFLPVAAVLAEALGKAPISLTLPVALAASAGFMLPVATPPNTLAYATGYVTVAEMIRAGALLDAICIVVIVAAVYLLGPLAFGI